LFLVLSFSIPEPHTPIPEKSQNCDRQPLSGFDMLHFMNDSPELPSDLLNFVREKWGFESLRSMQAKAIRALLDRRDSLVIMPTGGGKSLCYQAPAAFRSNELTVVVSPLIALMKDQVDSLTEVGICSVRVDSSLDDFQRREAFRLLNTGQARLLFASPEKLASNTFREYLLSLGVKTFAIDEAHCISQWGHDFRPEYRRLAELRQIFPEASFHAFTATATPRVRQDILTQLALRDPVEFVGNFDRANLCYRMVPKTKSFDQVLSVLQRHPGEAGIIYCLSRKEVDKFTARLRELGLDARRYRACNPDEDKETNDRERRETQDAFIAERCNLVVATVAFGMGIDRPDLRFVIHVGMPQSIENYQQEAGRAGRDGLSAECVMLYSRGDVTTRKEMVKQSAEQGRSDPATLQSMLAHVDEIYSFCVRSECRHKGLVEYFGQKYPFPNCGACDICLDEVDYEPDSTTIAKKILSAVARVEQRFGISYVADILQGVPNDRSEKAGHTKLSVFGLLKDRRDREIRSWCNQLISQDMLLSEGSEYPVLKVTPLGWEVMKGQHEVRLATLGRKSAERKSRTEDESWEGVSHELYEALRKWRRKTADAQNIAPFHIFSDKTLREIAKVRPTNTANLQKISGISPHKASTHGTEVCLIVAETCLSLDLPTDLGIAPTLALNTLFGKAIPTTARASYPMFREGRHPAEVAASLSVAERTARDYLCYFIHECKPKSIRSWIDAETEAKITRAAEENGTERMRPIFEALQEQVPYDQIRLVLTFLGNA